MSQRIDVKIVEASYYRRARCTVCGKTAERSRTFQGASVEACAKQAAAWGTRPLVHKRCESRYVGEEPL